MWDTVKAVLRGKFIAIQAYLKKRKKTPNKSHKEQQQLDYYDHETLPKGKASGSLLHRGRKDASPTSPFTANGPGGSRPELRTLKHDSV